MAISMQGMAALLEISGIRALWGGGGEGCIMGIRSQGDVLYEYCTVNTYTYECIFVPVRCEVHTYVKVSAYCTHTVFYI